MLNNTSADRRVEEGARLMEQLSEWIGREVMGTVAEKIVANGAPVMVRVLIPTQPELALSLFFLPLELAHVNGH